MAFAFDPFVEKSLKSAPDDIKVYPLAGDASNRHYYRVLEKIKNNSYVLMEWEPFKETEYPFLSVLQHFKKNGVHVPEVISLSPSEGLVLLEDLGDLTLERRFWESQNQELSLPFYKKAIDEIIKIHFKASADKASPCTAFHIQFDTEKLLWEMNYGKENLIKLLCQFPMSSMVELNLEKVFNSICSRLHAEPKYICHRDYHSRNLMIKFDEMRVIDFQDARMGPVQYDLVSLLRDSYVNMNEEIENSLLEYYFSQAPDEWRKNLNRTQFQEIYELQSVQRCFKACGSFASFYNQRKDSRYLKYIQHTLKRVMKSLAAFPEHRLMSQVLEESGALEKNYENLT